MKPVREPYAKELVEACRQYLGIYRVLEVTKPKSPRRKRAEQHVRAARDILIEVAIDAGGKLRDAG
jgi:hypothetical protein